MAEVSFWLGEGSVVGGRYRIEKVLGVGGYGITYQGMDTRLERVVAVKEFYPTFWASRFSNYGPEVRCMMGMEEQYAKGIKRFRDEALTLAQLSQVPGVVRVDDYFEENNTAYLVMDFLDGKNLKQMADGFGGRIPAEVLLPVISPVITALKQVHAKDLIHRDISPDNIMMLSDGSVQLIDFGNARDTSDNKSMTMAMKEGFAAPEMYRSKGQGTYTDVYGVCATLYYCLTGQCPPTAMDRLTGAKPMPRPSEMGVEIESWQEQAILDGLDLFVHQRIQTMDQLYQRLYVAPVQSAPGQVSQQTVHSQQTPTVNSQFTVPVSSQFAAPANSQFTQPVSGNVFDQPWQPPQQPQPQQPGGYTQPVSYDQFESFSRFTGPGQQPVPAENQDGGKTVAVQPGQDPATWYGWKPPQQQSVPQQPLQPHTYVEPSASNVEQFVAQSVLKFRNVCSDIFKKIKEL